MMFKVAHINISAYRVLRILVLFMQHTTLSLSGLGQHLINDPLISRTYTPETLARYINTLSLMGCQFQRIYHQHQYQYQLQRHPFATQFNQAQLEGVLALATTLQATPNTPQSGNDDYRPVALQLFSKHLQAKVTKPDDTTLPLQTSVQDTIQGLLSTLALQAHNTKVAIKQSPLPAVSPTLCQQFNQYCQQGQLLQIDFKCLQPTNRITVLQHHPTLPTGQLQSLTLEPWYVSASNKEPTLYGYNWHTQAKVVLLLSHIVSVKQLAQRCQQYPREVANTTQQWVEFKLSGRLAKTYRPYPQEKTWFMDTTEQPSSQLMVQTPLPCPNAQDDLVQRLLKYGQHCLVLEPYFIRTRIEKHIRLMTTTLYND
jgi:predicted DNA-binding transcriptional regulator YafY